MSRATQRPSKPSSIAAGKPSGLWGGYYIAISRGGGFIVEPATVIAGSKKEAIGKLIYFSQCKFEEPNYYGHNAEVMPVTVDQIVQVQRGYHAEF
jgi:hypothetical protein